MRVGVMVECAKRSYRRISEILDHSCRATLCCVTALAHQCVNTVNNIPSLSRLLGHEMAWAYPRLLPCVQCDRIGIPFAPVVRPDELFEDPHLNESGQLLDVEVKEGVWTRLPKVPLEMGQHKVGELRSQPPRAGQHTREILGELGLDAGEIDRLRAEDVVLTYDD